jgi:hypothetical protein
MARFKDHLLLFGGDICYENPCLLHDTWLWTGRDWRRVRSSNHPTPRAKAGMAYDVGQTRVVLFGGEGYFSDLNDTWIWDGSAWTLRHPPLSPPPREEPGMAYDAARREVVLFGGSDLADTWRWDGSTWTCLAGCP